MRQLAILLLILVGSGSVTAQMTREEALKEMRPSTGIEAPPPDPYAQVKAWLPWIGGGLVGLALVGMAVVLRRGNRRGDERAVLPHVRALREIAAIAAQPRHDPAAYEHYCVALSEVVRHYVEERWRMPATKQTTPEFLAGLRQRGYLRPDQEVSLQDFLQACDLAKFAGVREEGSQGEALAVAARKFVEQTR